MKIIPTFRCLDLKASLEFYTKILGFELNFVDEHLSFAGIKKENCEIHLSTFDGASASVVYILVDEVDELFQTFIKNGLDNSHKKNSPVHQGPTNQTWGMREFYVDDPNGNTLRLGLSN